MSTIEENNLLKILKIGSALCGMALGFDLSFLILLFEANIEVAREIILWLVIITATSLAVSFILFENKKKKMRGDQTEDSHS